MIIPKENLLDDEQPLPFKTEFTTPKQMPKKSFVQPTIINPESDSGQKPQQQLVKVDLSRHQSPKMQPLMKISSPVKQKAPHNDVNPLTRDSKKDAFMKKNMALE